MSLLTEVSLKKLDFSAFLLNIMLIFFTQLKLPIGFKSAGLVVLPLVLLGACQFFCIRKKRPGTVIWPAALSSSLAVIYYLVIGANFSTSADPDSVIGNALLLLPLPAIYVVTNLLGMVTLARVQKT